MTRELFIEAFNKLKDTMEAVETLEEILNTYLEDSKLLRCVDFFPQLMARAMSSSDNPTIYGWIVDDIFELLDNGQIILGDGALVIKSPEELWDLWLETGDRLNES